jgi:hypothetical protein
VHAWAGGAVLCMHVQMELYMRMRVQVELYENEEECWVVKVALASLDSAEGFAAYLRVLLRSEARVRSLRLSKVVEHWNITPGDGNAYFACTYLHTRLCLLFMHGSPHVAMPFPVQLLCMQAHSACKTTRQVRPERTDPLTPQ